MIEDSSEFVSNEQQTSDERVELYRSQYFVVSKIRLFGKWRIEKRLTPEYEFQPLQRTSLEREFEIGYQLEHPNIVRYLELRKTEQGVPYIIMEYADGMNLQEYMQSDENCTKKDFSDIFSSLLSALSYLQQNQIYHLDIKPENIVVTYKEHIPKLIDFGVSNTDTYQTSLGSTKQYRTKEHTDYSRVSSKTDMYSFAKTMNRFAKTKKIKLSHAQKKIIRVSLNENPEQRISANNAFAFFKKNNHWVVWVIIFVIILIFTLLISVLLKHKAPIENGKSDTLYIIQKDTIVTQKDAIITQKDAIITQKDTIITQKDTIITQKDTIITQKDAIITQKDAIITQKDTIITQKDAITTRKNVENTSHAISTENTSHTESKTANNTHFLTYDGVLANLLEQEDTKFKFSKEDSLFIVAEIIECKRKTKKLMSENIHIVEDGIHTRAHIKGDSISRRLTIVNGFEGIQNLNIDSMLLKYRISGDYETYYKYWNLKKYLEALSLEELEN